MTLRLVHATSDAAMIACSASKWKGEPKRCVWCNKKLTGRRTRWCSDACGDEFGKNHWWTTAAKAAKKRDGYACVRCGSRGTDYGIGERGLQVHHTTPLHTILIEVRDWNRELQDFVIATRKVRHSDSGCWHHLDGLETLCAKCHVEEHATPEPESDQLSFDEHPTLALPSDAPPQRAAEFSPPSLDSDSPAAESEQPTQLPT